MQNGVSSRDDRMMIMVKLVEAISVLNLEVEEEEEELPCTDCICC